MCDPTTIIAIATVAGTAASVAQGQQQQSQAKKAAKQAQANADKAATQADQEMNARNMKKPDTAAMYSANQQSAQSGIGSTMLTGAGGVDPNSLVLGKQTLLGA